MNDGKRTMEYAKNSGKTGSFSAANEPSTLEKFCSACGTPTGRKFAKYCRVCGKFLFEEYQPLDNLRASYHLQGKAIVYDDRDEREPVENLFEINENGASQTTWACFVYSLVPYIGIIFVPLTFIFGGFSLFVSLQKPALGGRRLTLASMGLSLVVLAIQILLWWLLYIIPTLGRQ